MSFTFVFLLLAIVILPFAFPGGAVFDSDPLVAHSSLQNLAGGNAESGPWAFVLACRFGEAWLLRCIVFLTMIVLHVALSLAFPGTLVSEVVLHAVLWLGILALLVSILGILAIVS